MSQSFDPRFDQAHDRRGSNCSKWDGMERIFGVPSQDGLAMWVADMDFRAPDCVQRALADYTARGIYGYADTETALAEATAWWMQTRHGWALDPSHVMSTNGMVNAVALALDAFSAPGDGVVIFTPVYHAFRRVIEASGRHVVDCPLAEQEDRHVMDLAAYDALITENTKIIILCSPHNPGGQVWTLDELRALADFAKRHDLILISDEIHHDLVYPGHTHTPMAVAAPEIAERLVMMSATTKTFNIAGAHIGQVTIADPALRARFMASKKATATGPGSFGLIMAEAAYSPEGAEWLDGLMAYLDGNRKLFDQGIAAIPGLRSMPLEATYLAWVDLSGTGMSQSEITHRVRQNAKIAASPGADFGPRSEHWLRFNLGMPRAQITEAVSRLQNAFGDLQ
ncbi:MAG: pyridoxal phosphate-dependent aminotransferase [Mangrovicoccus sp.]|nr:pyridoxal phosphate-dependent aminotransferase [Mangrovicoccus sp.]